VNPSEVKSTREPYAAPPPDTNGRGHGASDDADADDAETTWESRVTPAPPSWFRESPPPRTWLLRDPRLTHSAGVVPLGHVGQLTAEGGIGKTMALCQLALAVATGTKWLGTFDVAPEGAGRVLLALGEETTDEVRRRLHYAARAAGIVEPPPGSIVTLPLSGVTCPMIERGPDGNPIEAPFLIWLREHLAREPDLRLVILDPLTRFAGLDAEVDNACATRFVQATESLVQVTRGAAIFNAHHTNKLSRNKGKVETASARGSTALTDGARLVWTMGYEDVPEDADADLPEEIIVLAHTKSNYSKRAASLLLRRSDEHHGALVPLGEDAVTRLREAQSKPVGGRRTARDAYGDERRAKRRAEDEASREAKRRQREQEALAERERVNAVVRQCMSEGLTGRELRNQVKARACVGTDTADTAIARCRSGSVPREGGA